MSIAELVALAGLAMNVLVAVIGLTWGIKKIGDQIEEKIEAHRNKFDSDIEKVRRETGEVGMALRTKVQEVELFIRDSFVRRDSFYETMRQYGDDMRVQFAKIDSRLERMETKIDAQH